MLTVHEHVWPYYLPLVDDSMFELGGKWNSGLGLTYKSYFESIGFRHVSVDWAGQKYGALNRDLRQPQWPEFGQFDMVTNIGTTEHVQGQAGVWENIHRLTKAGGVLVTLTPYYDGKSWWWHGEYYPTEAFFESFAELNGWEIERMDRVLPPPHTNLQARLRKLADGPFTMPDESLIHYNQMRAR